jgi:oligopeptide/dipeptide ABC transporter ATP-binding protein
MLISHDIDVIKALSDKVAVMYGGTILEHGPSDAILSGNESRKHPYTAALLESIPDRQQIKDKAYLRAIKGEVLDTINLPEGCRFYPRCDRVTAEIRKQCEISIPELKEISPGHQVRCWLYGE